MPPLALYLHFPWCARKCPYCDFNSHAHPEPIPETRYLDALREDLEADNALGHGRPIHSVFIGGGTPSLISPDIIAGALTHIDRQRGFAANAEITLEANPGSSDASRFAGYRAAGVNRLSIGVQSFDAAQLQTLGRIHTPEAAADAIRAARTAGFDNINIDIMHALPQQSLAQALRDLEQALAFEPEHLSWYELTIEPNTEFHNRPPALPDEDSAWEIQQQGRELLAQAGFHRYEISAYAQTGRESRHNLNYWLFGDYLALGAGAHGKVQTTDGVLRYRKTRQPGHYLDRIGSRTAARHIIEPGDLPLEFLMNALRLPAGFDPALFTARTGLPSHHLTDTLRPLQQDGLLEMTAERIRCSPRGLEQLNGVLAAIA